MHPSSKSSSFNLLQFILGGKILSLKINVALITFDIPAAALVCPILGLIEPIYKGSSISLNTSFNALISTASPKTVPVPWVSIYPTSSGSIPETNSASNIASSCPLILGAGKPTFLLPSLLH